MENKKNLRKLHTILLATGIPMTLLEWFTIYLWAGHGNFIPFIILVPIFLAYAIIISRYYFNRVAYVCPHCGEVFVPTFKEAFFANHTPTLRKLRCPKCEHKGFCVEIYRKKDN